MQEIADVIEVSIPEAEFFVKAGYGIALWDLADRQMAEVELAQAQQNGETFQ